MYSTVEEIYPVLTGTFDHTELWLQTRPWPSHMKSCSWPEQHIIVSRSGRILAQRDGNRDCWYLDSGIYSLWYDPELDCALTEPEGYKLDSTSVTYLLCFY